MEKRRVGRPLKFETVEELQEAIDGYFSKTGEKVGIDGKTYWVPCTVSGLALALGTTRRTLLDYEEREEFTHTIEKAKLRCENDTEEWAISGRYNAPFAKFSMINNYGYQDKVDTENVNKTFLYDGFAITEHWTDETDKGAEGTET